MLENVKLWSSSKDQCSFSNSSTLPRDWRLCSVSCYRILHSYLIIEWQGWPNSVCGLPARPTIANATLARTYHAEWGPREGDFLRWRPLCLGIFHPLHFCPDFDLRKTAKSYIIFPFSADIIYGCPPDEMNGAETGSDFDGGLARFSELKCKGIMRVRSVDSSAV